MQPGIHKPDRRAKDETAKYTGFAGSDSGQQVLYKRAGKNVRQMA